MNFIKNASIGIKLSLMAIVSLMALLTLIGVSNYVLNNIKIGSSTYNKIINSKDLLADILPLQCIL